MFKCNILIFKFCTLLTKSTNQPAHEPTSTTNQPAPQTNQHHKPTSKARTNRKTDTTRHKKQSAGYLYRKIKNSSFFGAFKSKNKY